MLKVHTVKSNAKRAARKLCETFAGIDVAEPIAATPSPAQGYLSAVRVAPGCLPSAVAPEVLEQAVVVDLGPLWEVRGTEIVRSAAGREADDLERVDPDALADAAAFAGQVAANGGTNEGMGTMLPAASDPAPKVAHGGRQAQVFALLQREEGATIAQVMAATGWLAHTTRAFISVNARKLGLSIEKEKTEAGQVYRAVEPKAAA